MAKKLIVFTIENAGQNDYANIKHKIGQISQGWAKIDETTYVINTDRSSVAVRESLTDVTLSGKLSVVFVCEWAHPSAWKGLSKEVSDWLHNN